MVGKTQGKNMFSLERKNHEAETINLGKNSYQILPEKNKTKKKKHSNEKRKHTKLFLCVFYMRSQNISSVILNTTSVVFSRRPISKDTHGTKT